MGPLSIYYIYLHIVCCLALAWTSAENESLMCFEKLL